MDYLRSSWARIAKRPLRVWRHVQTCQRTQRAWASRQGSSTNGWLIAILLVLTVILLFKMMGGIPSALFDADAQPRAITPRGDLAEDEKTTIELFGAASRSVVHINTSLVRRDRMSLDLLEIPQGSGSGFIWDNQGHIVTNFHVIQGAQVARVVIKNDETPYNARAGGGRSRQGSRRSQDRCTPE